jgi:hypothetical protein
MKDLLIACAFMLFVGAGGLCVIERVTSVAEARQIAAEARQEARDIDFEERQLERGCVQPERFESAHKRTD